MIDALFMTAGSLYVGAATLMMRKRWNRGAMKAIWAGIIWPYELIRWGWGND